MPFNPAFFMDKKDARRRVRQRANSLPSETRNCEACGGRDTMRIRRSSLNEQFYADDLSLKCIVGDDACSYLRTHGIPFEDAESFEEEMRLRNGRRVLDFAYEGPKSSVEENLRALGYLGRADMEE